MSPYDQWLKVNLCKRLVEVLVISDYFDKLCKNQHSYNYIYRQNFRSMIYYLTIKLGMLSTSLRACSNIYKSSNLMISLAMGFHAKTWLLKSNNGPYLLSLPKRSLQRKLWSNSKKKINICTISCFILYLLTFLVS